MEPLESLVGYLTGPTAVGKSEVGLRLAESHGWAILSVDSRQIYRRLQVGTAKPSPEEQARVPHLLLDELGPAEPCSAGRFRSLALEALARLAGARGRALAVGGAGLYWEALAQGLHPLPLSSPEVRARLKQEAEGEGGEELYRRLQEVDPVTAGRLSPRDRQRIERALEVYELAGEPLSRILSRPREPDARSLPVVALMRSRRDLYRRIEERCDRMLSGGLVEELRSLLAEGVDAKAPGLRTVGYREFLPHLLEGESLSLCRERFMRNSRRYAKRQETWLRHRLPDRIELLVAPEETPSETAARVEGALKQRDPLSP